MKKTIITLLKETLAEMIISTVLLAMAALIVLKVSPSLPTIKIMILAIYGIASFGGGIIMGKVMETKKFLWGALAGGLYFTLIIIVALIVKGSISTGTVGIISGFIVSMTAGTVGGMVS
jgi:putative membrane protein (TIGR04086 family)